MRVVRACSACDEPLARARREEDSATQHDEARVPIRVLARGELPRISGEAHDAFARCRRLVVRRPERRRKLALVLAPRKAMTAMRTLRCPLPLGFRWQALAVRSRERPGVCKANIRDGQCRLRLRERPRK